MKTFDHSAIEKKWQKKWEEQGLYTTADQVEGKDNAYTLVEFPYPSGNLHIGHWYAFAVPDIYARYLRMNGKNVLYPIGFDAFGLPAENAAIKRGLDPRKWTYDNIDFMTGQLKSMGNSFDWSRKVVTCDPEYYKWTQWLFLQLYEKGLAYKRKGTVPWCDSCKTVLANEQIVSGACERCSTQVVQKNLDQWYFKITEYAERLLADLDDLDWPEEIKQAQREWIGKSAGALLKFKVQNEKCKTTSQKPKVLIIHGFAGDPSEGWKPWLKETLEAMGYEVRSPKMPHFDHPDYEECMAFLETQVADFSESDIVVGHSLGGHFALKLAERHTFGKVVLVAPTIGGFDFPYDDWKRNDPGLDFDSCKKILQEQPARMDSVRATHKVAIFGETDRGIPIAHADMLDSSWTIIKKADTGHMSHEKEVPEILEAVVSTSYQATKPPSSAVNPESCKLSAASSIEVFTTRPDTLYGVTYVVLAPEHELVAELLENKGSGIKNYDEVRAYVEQTKSKKELERKEGKEKTGVELKGVTAINPANGEAVPVWIADYVLASYGTGAVMAVPAHDERDWEFAKKYGLKIRKVIAPQGSMGTVPSAYRDNVLDYVKSQLFEDLDPCYTGTGLLVNSRDYSGITSEEAISKIVEHAGGTMTTQYRLRDWLLSRQRYWGAPIPVVYDPDGKPHPVPEEHLPWTLPNDVDFTPTGEAPLATSKDLRERTEQIFGKGWTPEVDTMDTFVCSSWYFLRYLDPHNDTEFSPLDKQKAWMPVDRYSGGAEHTTMHLLYSRFFYKALSDLGLVTESEPYMKRMSRGLILGPDGQKMSKSKGNVIDPDEHVARVGADTVKTYLAFIGPYNEVGQYPWDLGGIAGVRRFLERVWNMNERCQVSGVRCQDGDEPVSCKLKPESLLALHQTIKKVGDDIQAFKFNTAISQMMILVNALEKEDSISSYAYESLIRILAPFAPHLTEELWESLGHTTSIHLEPWPTYDESIIASAQVTIAVQVNGKVRDTFTTAPDSDRDTLLATAKALPKIATWLDGKEIVKVVVVPNRLVNFVLLNV